MDDYKVDRAEVALRNEEHAMNKLSVIQDNANGKPIPFLRSLGDLKKIKERITEPHFGMTMAAMIVKICGLSGIKNEITDFDKDDISKLIMRKYGELTPEELMKAFELERFGEYPERTDHFQLFNAEYFSKVVDKFKVWKQQTKMQFNITPQIENKLEEISESAKREIMNNAIIRLFNEFKETKEVSIPCVHVFDEMYERKLFDPKTDYQTYHKIAKREVSTDLNNTKAVNKIEYNQIKEAKAGVANKTNDEKVLAKAKKLVLHDFFQKLLDENEDITSTIN